jgi:hypothetical protein
LVAGVQLPVHAPAPEHTNGQGVPVFVQFPVASQTCGCNPTHCLEVGAHVAHPPFTQATPQVLVLVQLPVASHVCTWLVIPVVVLQRVVVGWQTPVH